MKYLYIFILSGISIYFLVVILIYFNQRNLLYLPNENKYLDDQIQFNYEEVFIEVEKDINLKTWFVKKDLRRYKTLVFFHGNAGNLFNRTYKLNKLNNLEINILITSWRSFSENPGKPTEQNLYQDSKKIINWLNNKGVRNEKIILYGESLGTGVAVELGQSNEFNSIILESPYTSMTDAAKIYYPYLPVHFLLKDKYDSINKILEIKTPILIMHGMKDQIVPFSMGVKLFDKANTPKYSYFPENDDHMMSYNEELLKAISRFIEKY